MTYRRIVDRFEVFERFACGCVTTGLDPGNDEASSRRTFSVPAPQPGKSGPHPRRYARDLSGKRERCFCWIKSGPGT
jgi:hypothetical protein